MLVELYTTFTYLAMAAPSRLFLLSNSVEDMEQVHDDMVLLLLLLKRHILMQSNTGWNGVSVPTVILGDPKYLLLV